MYAQAFNSPWLCRGFPERLISIGGWLDMHGARSGHTILQSVCYGMVLSYNWLSPCADSFKLNM